MTRILAALMLSSALSLPALAQSDNMMCSDFVKMDGDAQMKAVSMMDDGKMAADGNMMASGATKPEGAMMQADGAMKSEGAMKPEGEMMKADGGMMADGDATMAVANYCKDHPTAMVQDAMMQTKAH